MKKTFISLGIIILILIISISIQKNKESQQTIRDEILYGDIRVLKYPETEYEVCGRKLKGIAVYSKNNENYIAKITDMINKGEFAKDGGPTCKWVKFYEDGWGEGFPTSDMLGFTFNIKEYKNINSPYEFITISPDIFPRPDKNDNKDYYIEINTLTNEIKYFEYEIINEVY